ncbi:unnamed protein product [Rhizoctonia solani]|uniref:BTB domain-containing protein n=1 Tax=Rhizoctonia solani TaxID=456999 RepID=A0A8H3HJP5_9AGAM|nr:unnamed protein product [Rhizoctonia solani]
MSVNRSDKYYFPRGDLVLRIDDTLFRLHQDILSRHSGFFEDMFSTPTSDDTEGTEENPLVLPSDLCSARSFTILCKLLYPAKMGTRLNISVKQLDEWKCVLQATVALQMTDTRKFILTRLDADTPNIQRDTAKLLRLSLDYDEAPPSLFTACLRILAYRRKPLTPDEVNILGGEGTCLTNNAREKIRESLSLCAIGVRPSKDFRRGEHAECISGAFSKMIRRSPDARLQQTDDTHDIFEGALGYVSCDLCSSSWNTLVESLETVLNKIVNRYVRGALSTPDTSQAGPSN